MTKKDHNLCRRSILKAISRSFLFFCVILQANATGGGGHIQLVQSAMKSLTFRTLCFPDNIKARGLDNMGEVPTYFYREDGHRVWEATKR